MESDGFSCNFHDESHSSDDDCDGLVADVTIQSNQILYAQINSYMIDINLIVVTIELLICLSDSLIRLWVSDWIDDGVSVIRWSLIEIKYLYGTAVNLSLEAYFCLFVRRWLIQSESFFVCTTFFPLNTVRWRLFTRIFHVTGN